MSNFNFTSQVCTSRSQSEQLLALGLKKETADMYYFWAGGDEYRLKVDIDNNPLKYNMDKTYIPAWSLHRIIEMMPCGFQDENYRNFVLKINSQGVSYVHNYVDDEGYGQSDSVDVDDIYHKFYDGIIAHIKWLIKEGLFNKEYLVG